MKCKILNCSGEVIGAEGSVELYGSEKYSNFCGLHSQERYRLDEKYKREEEEEMRLEEENSELNEGG